MKLLREKTDEQSSEGAPLFIKFRRAFSSESFSDLVSAPDDYKSATKARKQKTIKFAHSPLGLFAGGIG